MHLLFFNLFHIQYQQALWANIKYKYSIKGYTFLQTVYVDRVDFSTALLNKGRFRQLSVC